MEQFPKYLLILLIWIGFFFFLHLDLVDRQKIQIADAIKVMRYLTSSNSITQNDAGTKKKLQLKVRIFLHKYIANKKNKKPITSNRWIPIGRTNTPNGVSKISMLAQSSTEPYREAFRNSLKTLLMKENVTSEYLSRLTRVVQTMAKSILLQAQANPQYDRKQIDYHLHNMTSKIWTLLKNMNSTGHRIHPKMFTQGINDLCHLKPFSFISFEVNMYNC